MSENPEARRVEAAPFSSPRSGRQLQSQRVPRYRHQPQAAGSYEKSVGNSDENAGTELAAVAREQHHDGRDHRGKTDPG
jgi:hypothetical protein